MCSFICTDFLPESTVVKVLLIEDTCVDQLFHSFLKVMQGWMTSVCYLYVLYLDELVHAMYWSDINDVEIVSFGKLINKTTVILLVEVKHVDFVYKNETFWVARNRVKHKNEIEFKCSTFRLYMIHCTSAVCPFISPVRCHNLSADRDTCLTAYW